MRNLDHDTSSVAVFAHFRSAVPHILQHLQCIVNQFVTLIAVDVHNHSHTARIVLIVALVESFLVSGLLAIRHIILLKS